MRKSSSGIILASLCALFLAGCSSHQSTYKSTKTSWKGSGPDPFAGVGSPYYKGRGPIPFGGGKYHVGNAYQVAGRTWTPHEQPDYDKTGVASWYGEAFHKRKTSNGEWFDMNTLTAAHATLPLPSYAMVTNLDNGRKVIVRINDRGPFVDTRIIDLSKKAADVLGYRNKGKTHVRVKLIGPAPLRDSAQHMVAMNEAMANGASVSQIASMADDTNAQAPVQVATRKRNPKYDVEPQDNGVQQASFEPQDTLPSDSAGYIVRVGVFHDLENAKLAYNQLAGFGPTQIVKAVGANGPLYRVQIGPLDNKEDANTALDTAISNGFEDARIVETQIQQVAFKN
jgi:rare lipoprotein A